MSFTKFKETYQEKRLKVEFMKKSNAKNKDGQTVSKMTKVGIGPENKKLVKRSWKYKIKFKRVYWKENFILISHACLTLSSTRAEFIVASTCSVEAVS